MWRGEGFTAVGEGVLQLPIYLLFIDFCLLIVFGRKREHEKGLHYSVCWQIYVRVTPPNVAK